MGRHPHSKHHHHPNRFDRSHPFSRGVFECEKEDDCCRGLKIRHDYRHYHRFFIFSPLFLLFVLGLAFFAIRGQMPSSSYPFVAALIGFVTLKDLIGFAISRRIFNKILRPVEELKMALFEVSRGNYGVEVSPTPVDEFNQLIKAFNAMSLELKASEEIKARYEANRKELVASISHDLKTPITSINGFIDGILDGVADSPEKQVAYFKIIQQNARYMNRLVDDLLLYSKLDLHKMSFEFAPINVGDYLEELFQELYLEHDEQGIAMKFENSLQDTVFLDLDAKHLTRAIRNVVANAVAYGQTPGGKVDFLLFKPEGDSCVCLQIRDNGPGIPAEQLQRIFERFFRGDDARGRTTATGGSGLGLAIAKEIVEAHEGTIRAESEVGHGTAVIICLPLKKEEKSCQSREF